MKVLCQYKELVDITKLTPHKSNPNKHPDKQIELLAKGIEFQGWRHPVIVSKRSGFVVAGHGRIEAAKKLGYSQVPVDYQDFKDEATEYAFLIADNKLDKLAIHDDASMIEELKVNEALKDLDFDLLGLPDFELPDEPDPAKEETEDQITVNVETRTKPGDLWSLGNHRLLIGDSTNPDHVKRLVGNDQPILMITDPPYGVNYDANWRAKAAEQGFINFGTSQNVGKVQNDDRADWSEVFALIPFEVGYVWHADKYSSLVQKSLEDNDCKMIAQIIWVKPTFAISRSDYHWRHEPCWYFHKNGKKHNWQGARDQSTVWEFSRDTENHGHGTPKPVALVEKSILNSSAKGQVIIDPFGGSGTTLIAAEKTKRQCLMMEIEPSYGDIILNRYESYSGQKASLINP